MLLPAFAFKVVNLLEISQGKEGFVAVRASFDFLMGLGDFHARMAGTYK